MSMLSTTWSCPAGGSAGRAGGMAGDRVGDRLPIEAEDDLALFRDNDGEVRRRLKPAREAWIIAGRRTADGVRRLAPTWPAHRG